ncbi:MAG: LytTR family DNA-binding domain-containing protein [Pseudomonadota bacterium]
MKTNSPVINGSVFSLWPLGRTLAIVGVSLVVLLVIVEPEASLGLGVVERTLFWTVNIGMALSVFYAASLFLLPRFLHHLPAWLALLLAGIAGAALLAPFAYLVEQVQPASWHMPDDGDALDRFKALGTWQGVLAKFLEAGPQLLLLWMAINLPFVYGRFAVKTSPDGSAQTQGTREEDLRKDEAGSYAEEARKDFLSELPEALGTNVLAISSDLHYLHVHTDQGHCMILGSLQRANDALGDTGMRVHRAHWVARRAIVKIVKDGQQWSCLLTNGLKIPISRRNKSTVAGWFGHSTKITPVKDTKRGAA